MPHDVAHSLFSSRLEVHAAVVGLTVGLLAAVLWERHPHLSTALLSFAAALALARPAEAVRPLVAKPWYFLGPVAVAVVAGVVAVRVATGGGRLP